MFNEDKNIAAAQKVMLDILIEVHKICVKHNITYWLEAGTLLGAVRHKGFIPWDDDIDISMPREDYEKFLEIAQRELPSDLFLQTNKTDPEYSREITKVRKLNTLLIETGETGNENYCHGIFIDIFPYDYYKKAWFVKWMRWTCLIRNRKEKYKRGTFKRAITTLYTNIFLLIPIEISKFIKNKLAKKPEWFRDKNSEYFSFTLFHGIPCATKTKDILPVKLEKNIFEGYAFFIPRNSRNFLKVAFGDDYMELPPLSARKTHAKKIESKLQ